MVSGLSWAGVVMIRQPENGENDGAMIARWGVFRRRGKIAFCLLERVGNGD